MACAPAAAPSQSCSFSSCERRQCVCAGAEKPSCARRPQACRGLAEDPTKRFGFSGSAKRCAQTQRRRRQAEGIRVFRGPQLCSRSRRRESGRQLQPALGTLGAPATLMPVACRGERSKARARRCESCGRRYLLTEFNKMSAPSAPEAYAGCEAEEDRAAGPELLAFRSRLRDRPPAGSLALRCGHSGRQAGHTNFPVSTLNSFQRPSALARVAWLVASSMQQRAAAAARGALGAAAVGRREEAGMRLLGPASRRRLWGQL